MTPFDTRFARTLRVTDERGTRTLHGFVQAMNIAAPETPTPTAAGVVDRRRWLLLLPEVELSGRVEVECGGRRYALLRREIADGHIEGILCLKGGGEGA